MRIVCISDTHSRLRQLEIPDGDLLIHAGDLTSRGNRQELEDAMAWMRALPHPHKVLIAGNHDWIFQRKPQEARELVQGVYYLEDSECQVDGLRIWGSPWQPWFYNWAFNLHRGAEIQRKWDLIPQGIDLLVTHGPPHGILDEVEGAHVGCEALASTVARISPRLHVFGHIHEGHGVFFRDGIQYVNASICDASYRPIQSPVVVELSARPGA